MQDPLHDYRQSIRRQHEFRRFVRDRLTWYGVAFLSLVAFALLAV